MSSYRGVDCYPIIRAGWRAICVLGAPRRSARSPGFSHSGRLVRFAETPRRVTRIAHCSRCRRGRSSSRRSVRAEFPARMGKRRRGSRGGAPRSGETNSQGVPSTANTERTGRDTGLQPSDYRDNRNRAQRNGQSYSLGFKGRSSLTGRRLHFPGRSNALRRLGDACWIRKARPASPLLIRVIPWPRNAEQDRSPFHDSRQLRALLVVAFLRPALSRDQQRGSRVKRFSDRDRMIVS